MAGLVRRASKVSAAAPAALTSAKIASRYRTHTMLTTGTFIDNLMLAARYTPASGDVVECGVWRGGVIRALADVLGPYRTYHLFDSFEGLPEVSERDGAAAAAWQSDVDGPTFYDNCRAEESYARELFENSDLDYVVHPGWFEETLPSFTPERPIALLRLDGDWYDSTMSCLENLVPHLAQDALVIIDDYHTWDGCSRAVHDYLSRTESKLRVRQSALGTAFMINRP